MNKQQTYLKSEQYYIDLHDLITIKECLDYYQYLYKKLSEAMNLSNKENVPEEKQKNDWLRLINMTLYSIKVTRFKNKKKTINEWRELDRAKQDIYDNAESGKYYCKSCEVLLDVISKDSWERGQDNELRVLFMYECPRCYKREAYYDDGEIWESKPTLCEKCGSEIDVSIKIDDDKDKTTWTHKCTGCDYKKVEIDDHKKWKVEREKEDAKDKELLIKFRKEFCFDEKEGNKAVLWSEDLSRFMSDMKKDKEKKQDPAYKKALSVKKLKVVELNKLVKETLEGEGYIELQFEKPEMGRYVAIPFVVQDEKIDREEYSSKQQLKKLLIKTLEHTNWRLMSDSVSYRVGYLNGRLKCYESESDLISLHKKS